MWLVLYTVEAAAIMSVMRSNPDKPFQELATQLSGLPTLPRKIFPQAWTPVKEALTHTLAKSAAAAATESALSSTDAVASAVLNAVAAGDIAEAQGIASAAPQQLVAAPQGLSKELEKTLDDIEAAAAGRVKTPGKALYVFFLRAQHVIAIEPLHAHRLAVSNAVIMTVLRVVGVCLLSTLLWFCCCCCGLSPPQRVPSSPRNISRSSVLPRLLPRRRVPRISAAGGTRNCVSGRCTSRTSGMLQVRYMTPLEHGATCNTAWWCCARSVVMIYSNCSLRRDHAAVHQAMSSRHVLMPPAPAVVLQPCQRR